MRPWLTIALALASTSTAEPEDEALAAYVRFARTTLPKLEKASTARTTSPRRTSSPA